jgi:SEC-C motif
MEVLCQIEGCTNAGAMPDHDDVHKCQTHMAESALKNQGKVEIIYPRRKPCPCGSKKRFGKCCGDPNELLAWFQQRINTIVYFFDKNCPNKECMNCKRGRNGIKVENVKHAKMLHDYAVQTKIKFTNIKNENQA